MLLHVIFHMHLYKFTLENGGVSNLSSCCMQQDIKKNELKLQKIV